VTLFIESPTLLNSASFFKLEPLLIRQALLFFSAAVILLPPPLIFTATLIFPATLLITSICIRSSPRTISELVAW
jgi:hypothetical protein